MTKWATPLALTRGLLIGLCLCWLSYTSLEGTERDPSQDRTLMSEVVEAIRLAAEQGFASAQYNLGLMYANGEGVPQDYVAAHMWFNLAGAQSSGDQRDEVVKARDGVEARMHLNRSPRRNGSPVSGNRRLNRKAGLSSWMAQRTVYHDLLHSTAASLG